MAILEIPCHTAHGTNLQCLYSEKSSQGRALTMCQISCFKIIKLTIPPKFCTYQLDYIIIMPLTPLHSLNQGRWVVKCNHSTSIAVVLVTNQCLGGATSPKPPPPPNLSLTNSQPLLLHQPGHGRRFQETWSTSQRSSQNTDEVRLHGKVQGTGTVIAQKDSQGQWKKTHINSLN